MFRNFIQNLDQKKLKVFFVFLIFSFVSWSISKLSQTYDSWIEVTLIPTKFPDSLLLKNESTQRVNLRLKASGFKLLGMQIGEKSEKVNLSSISKNNAGYYLTNGKLKNQWERRFSNAEILSLQPDSVFFDLYQVQAKKVKVKPKLGLDLVQNYVLLGSLRVEPDSIMIKGPASEIENINVIETVEFTLREVSENFSQKLLIAKPENFSSSEILKSAVLVSGNVVKFSEKVFELPIEVKNTPKGYDLRVFPKTVSLLCKAGEDDLRKLTESDFKVVAVYDSIVTNQNALRLTIEQKPKNTIALRLLENEVKFVLEPK
ncbi:CdaR family protein [Croceivirga thetidis]|uniref:YbbR-like domain-containing protein n=1 Tax=Croceivirga thetidis TaxID=2721623 RepID=A0ABX1GRJ3_9FLAO|nr:YbbR-like domain-containing protein [Croceivirga thetidis]NKI32555.1 YbbR-like domain-containing protein [Croceivirga thetidis]